METKNTKTTYLEAENHLIGLGFNRVIGEPITGVIFEKESSSAVIMRMGDNEYEIFIYDRMNKEMKKENTNNVLPWSRKNIDLVLNKNVIPDYPERDDTKNLVFEKNIKYNAMQTMAISALKNNHCPLHYNGLIFQRTETDTNGVTEHLFTYEGEERWFDDAFINNGRTHDNSMIIIEANKQI